jgi:F0F1-type ATP synthase gamma subunit
MRGNKSLLQEKIFMSSLMDMVASYEEIAAMKTRQVKKSVLFNRVFLEGLNEAYAYVSYSAAKFKNEIKRQREKEIAKEAQVVRVFLSTNTGLFGDLVRSTFDLFVKDSNEDLKNNKKTSFVVVGKIGVSFMSTFMPNIPYTYFDLADMSSDDLHIEKIFDFLADYQDIIVYHGIFKSILSQDSVKTFLLGEVNRIKGEISQNKKTLNFIFEPSVLDVNAYFEKQIRLILFEQTLNESSLSKYASRMINLNDAQERIASRSFIVNNKLRKLEHKNKNSSLFSNYLRNTLWTK